MENNLSQRAVRIIAASLLGADISSSELRRIAKGLNDPEFIDELQGMILLLSNNVKNYNVNQNTEEKSPSRISDEKSLYDFLLRKKISKSTLISKIEEISPRMRPALMDKKLTAREILVKFLRSHPSRARELQSTLEKNQDDPFLKGIMLRNNKEFPDDK